MVRRAREGPPPPSAVRPQEEGGVHSILLKLGFSISQAAVSKYMVRYPPPTSQTWRTFLTNHADCLASIDCFVVPTATFRLLFGFIVLHHERCRIVHFGGTAHPTADWVAQQIREAFPWDTAPRHLIGDRDGAFLAHTSTIITVQGPPCCSARTHRTDDPFSRPGPERSFPCPRSAVCIIVTNGSRLDHPRSDLINVSLWRRGRCRHPHAPA